MEPAKPILTTKKPKPPATYVQLKGRDGERLNFTLYDITPEKLKELLFGLSSDNQQTTQSSGAAA